MLSIEQAWQISFDVLGAAKEFSMVDGHPVGNELALSAYPILHFLNIEIIAYVDS